jgi:hypothetical protein
MSDSIDHPAIIVFRQQAGKKLELCRFLITPFQLGQESWPWLLRACLSHDRAAVPRFGLPVRLSGVPIEP